VIGAFPYVIDEPCETHTLYRCFEGDSLLYVGITRDPGRRLYDHGHSKDWWQNVTRIDLEHYYSRVAVEAAEQTAIAVEGPKCNIAGNVNRPFNGYAWDLAGGGRVRAGGPGRPRILPHTLRKRITAEREAGATLRVIAERLNGENVPTAHGGKRWYASTVRAVLNARAL
jgi:predicted GIY-YIG superfamily endonuclease